MSFLFLMDGTFVSCWFHVCCLLCDASDSGSRCLVIIRWHAVFNLDDINVAITHNYVSESNLATVLRFLECKQDQISGCRDREESIKPEFLKATLERALVQNGFQDVWKEAQHVAEQGWPCRAWTDDYKEEPRASRKRRRRRERCCDFSPHSSIMDKAKQNKEVFCFSFL